MGATASGVVARPVLQENVTTRHSGALPQSLSTPTTHGRSETARPWILWLHLRYLLKREKKGKRALTFPAALHTYTYLSAPPFRVICTPRNVSPFLLCRFSSPRCTLCPHSHCCHLPALAPTRPGRWKHFILGLFCMLGQHAAAGVSHAVVCLCK
jgi:hypothetical protein